MSISATATACALRCNGRPTETGVSRGRIPASLALPPIMDPLYGFQAINVEAQTGDRHSLLNWLKRMLAVRGPSIRRSGAARSASCKPANRRILAYLREYEGDTILCVANLGRTAQAVELDLHEFESRVPIELTGAAAFPAIGQLPYLLTLPPYGFLWFRLATDVDAPDWASSAPGVEIERYTFVLRPTSPTSGSAPIAACSSMTSCTAYVPQRRWFGAKDETIETVSIVSA